MSNSDSTPIQPISGTVIPRFAGPSTFARLPELRDVSHCDVAIVGIPFDAGTSYRPGARFGPQAIRQASRHLRTQYHPAYDTEPFAEQQVADAGDISCNPYNIEKAVVEIQKGATDLLGKVDRIISLGGDHKLPCLCYAQSIIIMAQSHSFTLMLIWILGIPITELLILTAHHSEERLRKNCS